MIKLTVTFVGMFERIADQNNRASSSAGNQVQCEILDALEALKASQNIEVHAFAARPIQAWPRGPLMGRVDGMGISSILNVPYLRRMHSSIKLLQFLFRCKSDIVFSYNPGFFDSIALLLYRQFSGGRVNLTSIIQDVHTGARSALGPRWVGDFFSMKFARRFDLLLPISKCIADDFGFDHSKVSVFGGGLTRQGRYLLGVNCTSPLPYAVFAGALEPYNGIDRLVSAWRSMDSDLILHIFGRGSCEQLVRDAASEGGNIIFHGFASEEVVADWQASAAVNFCLRYSIGINARYFFPSKFFNVLAAPGAVIVNKFEGLPAELEGFCFIIDDDLNNLQSKLKSVSFDGNFAGVLQARRDWLKTHAEWVGVVRAALDFFQNKKAVQR